MAQPDEVLKRIKKGYAAWVRSADYEKAWRAAHPRPWKRYLIGVPLLASPGLPIGLALIIHGVVKHRRIDEAWRKEWTIALRGVPIRTAILMSNTALSKGGVVAPALVLGAFDERFTDEMAFTIMAGAAFSNDPRLKKFNDEAYHQDRRRPLPAEMVDGSDAYAFDLMVDSRRFRNGKLEESHIWAMAIPGKAGQIRHIPDAVLDAAGVQDDPPAP